MLPAVKLYVVDKVSMYNNRLPKKEKKYILLRITYMQVIIACTVQI